MGHRQEHPIRDLLAAFDEHYRARYGLRYPFSGGRDSRLIKDLRDTYDDAQIRQFMAAFFDLEDSFIEQSGHSLGVFRACLPKVILAVTKTKRARERPDDYGHVPPCRTRAECIDRVLREGREARAVQKAQADR